MCTCWFLQCLCELIDTWRDFQTLVKYTTLTLDADIFGPLDKACQIPLWLYVSTCRDINYYEENGVPLTYLCHSYVFSSQSMDF